MQEHVQDPACRHFGLSSALRLTKVSSPLRDRPLFTSPLGRFRSASLPLPIYHKLRTRMITTPEYTSRTTSNAEHFSGNQQLRYLWPDQQNTILSACLPDNNRKPKREARNWSNILTCTPSNPGFPLSPFPPLGPWRKMHFEITHWDVHSVFENESSLDQSHTT